VTLDTPSFIKARDSNVLSMMIPFTLSCQVKTCIQRMTQQKKEVDHHHHGTLELIAQELSLPGFAPPDHIEVFAHDDMLIMIMMTILYMIRPQRCSLKTASALSSCSACPRGTASS